MLRTELYIPKTVTVGFQKRTDTFTGKLGYVIYTDHTGKLRKEKSWSSWRDHSIETITVDNTPMNGFNFNKGVQRHGYWGSGRSVVRVWDPRDFEFEISVDNLIGILMHSDVSKRDITEPCVFAWYGTELVLLPTNSAEYQESTKYTEKQLKKFSARDLKIGHTYVAKSLQNPVVYLGRLDKYVLDYKYGRVLGGEMTYHQKKAPSKQHVFIDPDNGVLYWKDPSSFIAHVEVEEVHNDFASIMDKFYTSYESQPIVGITVVPCDESNMYYVYWYVASADGSIVRLRYSWYGAHVEIHAVRWHPEEKATIVYSTFTSAEQELVNDIRRLAPTTSPGGRSSDNATEYISAINATQYKVGKMHYILADGKTTLAR